MKSIVLQTIKNSSILRIMKNRKRKPEYTRWCMGLALLLAACSGGSGEQAADKEEGVATVLPQENNTVTVMTLERKNFDHELVSNGKVEARQQADLSFRVTSEPVAHVYVKNGDRVRRGQKLAELDLFTLKNKLEQAENSLRQAELEMQDVLIGQGYSIERMADIPEEVKKLVEVKSGYGQSRSNYELARYELEQAVLTAPFDGVVANLTGKAFNRPDASEPFCRIIGTEGMEVSFTVLESELPLIGRGDRVDITPYASGMAAVTGSVSEINPLVDENGMVKVKAVCRDGSRLYDGMNVRVSVKRSVQGQLVIPKTAVVMRSGKQVVFTLKDGKAMWNYVQTGLENLTEYTVTGDGMEEGAQVIVTGNVNLAHEAPVTVESN